MLIPEWVIKTEKNPVDITHSSKFFRLFENSSSSILCEWPIAVSVIGIQNIFKLKLIFPKTDSSYYAPDKLFSETAVGTSKVCSLEECHRGTRNIWVFPFLISPYHKCSFEKYGPLKVNWLSNNKLKILHKQCCLPIMCYNFFLWPKMVSTSLWPWIGNVWYVHISNRTCHIFG